MTRNEFVAFAALALYNSGESAGPRQDVESALRLAEKLEERGIAPWKQADGRQEFIARAAAELRASLEGGTKAAIGAALKLAEALEGAGVAPWQGGD